MQLKPQDIVVVLKLIAIEDASWSYSSLSQDLCMSPSEVHQSIKRANASGLIFKDPRLGQSHNGRSYRPNRATVCEFLIHGLRYVFIAERGGETRGIPTAHAVAPLKDKIVQAGMPPVWPSSDGGVRGFSLSPLYRSAPSAAMKDVRLYEWLALVDALRAGQARERNLASKEIEKRLAV